MSEIDIVLRCTNRFCEVPSDDTTMAECVVEEMASLALLKIFKQIAMQEVSIVFPPISAPADAEIKISIRAQGRNPYPSVDLVNLDCAIEDWLACSLVELFGTLNVERCAVC